MNNIEDVKNYMLYCFYNSIITNPEIIEIEGKYSDISGAIKNALHEIMPYKFKNEGATLKIMMGYRAFNGLEQQMFSTIALQTEFPNSQIRLLNPTLYGIEILLSDLFEDYILIVNFANLAKYNHIATKVKIEDFGIVYYKQNARVKLSE